jgi:hypothetical protein
VLVTAAAKLKEASKRYWLLIRSRVERYPFEVLDLSRVVVGKLILAKASIRNEASRISKQAISR